VLDVTGAGPHSEVVPDFHEFYSDIASVLANDTTITTVLIKELSTGVSIPAAFEDITGGSASDLLPTSLAIRVSLDNQLGVNGGPYLAGFSTAALTTTGRLSSTVRTTLLGATDALASSLVTRGYQLRIDRPSVLTTVVAAQARIGERFDVIRRRTNDTPENYASTDLLV
jgi:hypothetical protein